MLCTEVYHLVKSLQPKILFIVIFCKNKWSSLVSCTRSNDTLLFMSQIGRWISKGREKQWQPNWTWIQWTFPASTSLLIKNKTTFLLCASSLFFWRTEVVISEDKLWNKFVGNFSFSGNWKQFSERVITNYQVTADLGKRFFTSKSGVTVFLYKKSTTAQCCVRTIIRRVKLTSFCFYFHSHITDMTTSWHWKLFDSS